MKIIKWIICLFTLMVSHALIAAPVKTIHFATEATYPPFEYIDEAGQMAGFDIDIAKAICQQIKANCTFSNQSFNSLIPSLKLGKFDAIIAALGVTPERMKEVNFTPSYYEPSASFVALSNKHYSLSDMKDKIIGVQQGTVFDKYLHDKYQNHVTIKTYASVQDAYLDLVLGRLDVVLADTPIAMAWLKQNGNSEHYTIVGKPVIDHDYFGAGYAIAINKNNPDLLTVFKQALVVIKANGTYETLILKHFGAKQETTTAFQQMHGYFLQLISGTFVTIKVAFISAAIGIVIGLLGALLESIPMVWLRYPAASIIFIIRGLPELLILFFIYFGLAAILSKVFHQYIDISSFAASVIALSLIFGAYASQVFRGAFLAIDPGQIDAGKAMGFNRMQIFIRIQIPQAWRHAIPGLGNLWLVLLKDTAIVMLIGLADLMSEAKIAASATLKPFTFYLIAAG